MPFASRLNERALIHRPIITQSDTGVRKVSSYSNVELSARCHLQVGGGEVVSREFGLEVDVDARIFFLAGQDVRPRPGDAGDAVKDRVTVIQKDDQSSFWIVLATKHHKDKLGGYVVAAVAQAASAV